METSHNEVRISDDESMAYLVKLIITLSRF